MLSQFLAEPTQDAHCARWGPLPRIAAGCVPPAIRVWRIRRSDWSRPARCRVGLLRDGFGDPLEEPRRSALFLERTEGQGVGWPGVLTLRARWTEAPTEPNGTPANTSLGRARQAQDARRSLGATAGHVDKLTRTRDDSRTWRPRANRALRSSASRFPIAPGVLGSARRSDGRELVPWGRRF